MLLKVSRTTENSVANHNAFYKVISTVPNIFSLSQPLVQSRIQILWRTVPSQAEVIDHNCSDHSTTSKEMAVWRALVSLHLTRIQDPTL